MHPSSPNRRRFRAGQGGGAEVPGRHEGAFTSGRSREEGEADPRGANLAEHQSEQGGGGQAHRDRCGRCISHFQGQVAAHQPAHGRDHGHEAQAGR